MESQQSISEGVVSLNGMVNAQLPKLEHEGSRLPTRLQWKREVRNEDEYRLPQHAILGLKPRRILSQHNHRSLQGLFCICDIVKEWLRAGGLGLI